MEVAKWTVLLSRHKTRKNKTFHDGTLILRAYTPTQRKVSLVDSEGKRLEDKYLAASEQIEPGQELEFQGYVVEIVEPLEDKLPSRQVVAADMPPPPASNTSSSFFRQTTIRGFLKNDSPISSPGTLVAISWRFSSIVFLSSFDLDGLAPLNQHVGLFIPALSSGRLLVRYTKTLGNRKTWHDGFLRPFPKNQRKVSLVEESGTVLFTKVLEKSDVLAPGSELQFGSHEVSIPKDHEEPHPDLSANLVDQCGKCENTTLRAEELSPTVVEDNPVSLSKELSKQDALESTKEGAESKEVGNKRNRPPWSCRTHEEILKSCKRPRVVKPLEQQDLLSQPKLVAISSCCLQGDDGKEANDSKCRTAEQSLNAPESVATTDHYGAGKANALSQDGQSNTWIPARTLRIQAMRESQKPLRSLEYEDIFVGSDKEMLVGRSEPVPDVGSNPVDTEDGGITLRVQSSELDGANESEAVMQDSLDFSSEHFASSQHMEQVLAGQCFQVADFWEGYKLYCYGYYSSSECHRRRFSRSKMGQIIRDVYKESILMWGPRLDDKVRSAWSFMEDYLQQLHGVHCTDISILVDKYEDAEELKATAEGQLLLAVAKDDSNSARHRSAELALKNSKRISRNNILERIDQDINRVNTGLANLQKHSKKAGCEVVQATDSEGSGQRKPSFSPEDKNEQGRVQIFESVPVVKKQIGVLDDDSPIFLVQGQPAGLLPLLPSVPCTVATARFCMETEWAKLPGQEEALSHFPFESGSTSWLCETEDPWTLEQEESLFAIAPAIAKACTLAKEDMAAVMSTSVTALLQHKREPWWVFSISFSDGSATRAAEEGI